VNTKESRTAILTAIRPYSDFSFTRDVKRNFYKIEDEPGLIEYAAH